MIAATNTGPRKLDISVPTSEFMKMARSWESYQNEIMGIAVRHIKKSVNMLLWNALQDWLRWGIVQLNGFYLQLCSPGECIRRHWKTEQIKKTSEGSQGLRL
jgi:hypothetical protein